MKKLLIFLRILLIYKYLYQIESKIINEPSCSFTKFCQKRLDSYRDESIFNIACINFDRFDEINIQCGNFSKYQLQYIIYPRKKLILNSSLDLIKLENYLTVGGNPKNSNIISIFKNLLGIDLNLYHNFNYKPKYNRVLIIELSNFEFFLNGKKLTKTCDKNLSLVVDEYKSIFSYHKFVEIYENSKFPSKLCPFVFRNAQIIQLYFHKLSNYFIVRKVVEFYDLNENDLINHNLNSHIKRLRLYVYKFELNRKFLNFKVYENLEEIDIFGQLDKIVQNVFLNLIKIRKLHLKIYNLKYFIHNNDGLEWLKSFLQNVTDHKFLIIFNENEDFIQGTKLYLYPNEDFCLFYNVSTQFNLYFDIKVRKCSCTILWIIKYNSNGKEPKDNICAKSVSFSNCNFRNMIKNCEFLLKNSLDLMIQQSDKNSNPINTLDFYFSVIYLKFIFNFILIPVFSFLGCLNNFLVCLVVHNNRKIELKEKLYTYMFLNSMLNLTYCLISFFDIVNQCTYMRVYCLPFYSSYYAQYYKIVLMGFLGNVLKLSSNLTYLLMIINRYVLVGRNHSEILEKASKTPTRIMCLFISLLSSLLSFSKLIEYEINDNFSFYDYPVSIISIDHPATNHSNKMFLVLYVFYDLFNFFLYTILALLFDIITLRNLKNTLMLKKKMAAHTGNNHHNQHELIHSLENASKDALHMVFASAFLNFLIRLPELLVVLNSCLITFGKNWWLNEYLCKYLDLCQHVAVFTNFFYLISISNNLFVYIKFNSRFRKCFKNLFIKSA